MTSRVAPRRALGRLVILSARRRRGAGSHSPGALGRHPATPGTSAATISPHQACSRTRAMSSCPRTPRQRTSGDRGTGATARPRRAADRWCSAAITRSPIRSCARFARARRGARRAASRRARRSLRRVPASTGDGDGEGQPGDRYSHACPFARVMEERLAARLIQVGVRTLNAHQRSQAAKFGVEVLGADRWRDAMPLIARLRGALYVSLDLDVLEPMLAPAFRIPNPAASLSATCSRFSPRSACPSSAPTSSNTTRATTSATSPRASLRSS